MWLDSDIEAALGWQEAQHLRCSGCGLPKDECMDPDAEGAYEATAFRCFACHAREMEAKRFRDGDNGGLYYALEDLRSGD